MKKLIVIMLALVLILTACNLADSEIEVAPPKPEPEPVEIVPIEVEPVEAEREPAPEPDPSEPELTYFVAPPTEISAQGRRLAEEFLIAYTSLFSFGVRAQDGSFHCLWESDEELLFDPPLVWFGFFDDDNRDRWSNTDFFDRDGNRIDHAVFIDEGGGIALRFELFDLDGNGIPEIIMRGGIPNTGASFVRLFRFADGQFRQVEVGEPTGMYIIGGFFFDNTGRLIIHLVDWGPVGYFYLDFTETGAELTEIITFSSEEQGDQDFETVYADHRTMFRTGLPLTRIHPLSELHEEITQRINASLLADLG